MRIGKASVTVLSNQEIAQMAIRGYEKRLAEIEKSIEAIKASLAPMPKKRKISKRGA